MAKLIQLRQRIKAIETIKKITHAMRLIAMSTHSHLKSLQDPLTTYTHTLDTIFAKLSAITPNWHHPIIHPEKASKTLLIIIGSQKGLCGSFNTNLFKLITYHLQKNSYPSLEIIAIGQKAIDFTHNHLAAYPLKHSYKKLNASRIESIAHEIAHMLIYAPMPYQAVIIASNTFKSFFVQKPHISTLIPFEFQHTTINELSNDYIWDQPPADVLNISVPQYLDSKIYFYLFQSLLAEHAARFISMDSATRNANSLLEATKLEYNKLRQAKITKELTELVGSFS
jgi:F-type H+-transporting ATPase subunit gamma